MGERSNKGVYITSIVIADLPHPLPPPSRGGGVLNDIENYHHGKSRSLYFSSSWTPQRAAFACKEVAVGGRITAAASHYIASRRADPSAIPLH
jgi:hypothetical protein